MLRTIVLVSIDDNFFLPSRTCQTFIVASSSEVEAQSLAVRREIDPRNAAGRDPGALRSRAPFATRQKQIVALSEAEASRELSGENAIALIARGGPRWPARVQIFAPSLTRHRHRVDWIEYKSVESVAALRPSPLSATLTRGSSWPSKTWRALPSSRLHNRAVWSAEPYNSVVHPMKPLSPSPRRRARQIHGPRRDSARSTKKGLRDG